ncbi:MAG: copper-binding protein [Ferrovum myxofaciens]|uniref:copper-binding protein n=1 Tax=Ferrovum myxofaciens TaxID=416213 RepID=UPI0023539479|nr:copper-binding protein [Ferrovum myxofaciens]QKE40435.1 MAG: copper-binding protein [Ferrovum myxofaciens]
MKTMPSTTLALLTLLSVTPLSHADGMNMNGMNMNNMPMSDSMAEPMSNKVHHAIGIVRKVDTANSRITISHEPIPSIQWPAMTMTFAVQNEKQLNQIIVGEKIKFDLVQSAKDQYQVTRITPIQ